MKRIIEEDEELTVMLYDEAGASTSPVEMVIRKGTYGLYIEFPNKEDQRGVLIDYFDGKLSVKVWADNDQDDFTHSIPLS